MFLNVRAAYVSAVDALKLDDDLKRLFDLNDRVSDHECRCELIQRYAPSPTAAPVWSCRWRACNISKCLVWSITPVTTIQTLGLKPQGRC